MEIKTIPLSLITPSPMNPRKTFDEDALQELAGNIEKQGLVQPITVRPITDSKRFEVVDGNADFQPMYEIVCGERRFRAVSRLFDKYCDYIDDLDEPHNPFDSISAIVRVMDDDEAFDAMITENLQRKDVDPIEEAFAFGELAKKGGTAEEIALRFGKSPRFVLDRIKLNNLIPEMIKAVREQKCPIVAAMIISKLDEDAQRSYFNSNAHSYNGYSKQSAENFVSNLFMSLGKALWYKSDNQADEDFEGGCNRKCSECSKNTANHGCLFYEMKATIGKCTDRTAYNAKSAAYIMSELDKLGDKVVRKGAPLEYGKVVLTMSQSSSESTEVKALKDAIRAGIEERGLELVNPDKAFRSRCWYKSDDDRTIKGLQSGEIYRVINLHDYFKPSWDEEFWYTKATSEENPSEGLPLEVQSILNKFKNESDRFPATLAVTAAETLAKSETYCADPLVEDERVLMLSIMLVNNFHLCKVVGCNDYTDVTAIREFVATHIEVWAQIMHGWICSQLQSHPILRMAEPVLADLGKLHCPDEYEKKLASVREKFEKSKDKAEKRLAELGYNLDGKPLIIKQDNVDKDILKQKKEMKKKHPDVILLFREGAFYTLYEEDAVIAAPILKLTLTKSLGKNPVDTCGFVASAIDKFLPMLVRAGRRVAICENLQDPKKKK